MHLDYTTKIFTNCFQGKPAEQLWYKYTYFFIPSAMHSFLRLPWGEKITTHGCTDQYLRSDPFDYLLRRFHFLSPTSFAQRGWSEYEMLCLSRVWSRELRCNCQGIINAKPMNSMSKKSCTRRFHSTWVWIWAVASQRETLSQSHQFYQFFSLSTELYVISKRTRNPLQIKDK
jgi:hypothetical protein